MPIINSKEGVSINSDHIVQFTHLRDGLVKVLLSTGIEVLLHPAPDFEERLIPVMPAAPGFVAVYAEHWPDGFIQYRLRSVIAWRICHTGNYPLFEGCDTDDDYEVMIDPAGGVYDADGNTYSTLDAWKTRFEKESKEQEAVAA